MPIELTILLLTIFVIGAATLVQQMIYVTKKQIWRACLVSSVAVTKWQNLMPFYQFKDKQLLVEYAVDGITHSCIIPFNRRFYNKATQGQSVYVFVDPNRPEVVAQKVSYRQLFFAFVAVLLPGFGLLY